MACDTAARTAGRAPVASRGYTLRDAIATVLDQVVREHLERFLATTRRADPTGVPAFLEQEFRAFLDCGVWARGFDLRRPRTAGLFACAKRRYQRRRR